MRVPPRFATVVLLGMLVLPSCSDRRGGGEQNPQTSAPSSASVPQKAQATTQRDDAMAVRLVVLESMARQVQRGYRWGIQDKDETALWTALAQRFPDLRRFSEFHYGNTDVWTRDGERGAIFRVEVQSVSATAAVVLGTITYSGIGMEEREYRLEKAKEGWSIVSVKLVRCA